MAVDDIFETDEDVAATFDVLANDLPSGSALFISDIDQPDHGTVTVNVDQRSMEFAPGTYRQRRGR